MLPETLISEYFCCHLRMREVRCLAELKKPLRVRNVLICKMEKQASLNQIFCEIGSSEFRQRKRSVCEITSAESLSLTMIWTVNAVYV